MKKTSMGCAALATVMLWIGGVEAAEAPQVSVIPQPLSVEARTGIFVIRDGTHLSIPQDPRAARVARYFATLLKETRGIEVATGGRSAGDSVIFQLTGHDKNPEGYTIEVSAHRVVLAASDPRGLFYAAVTLWQLCTASEASGEARIPAMKITDAPRFAWRGLLLDSARHYQSPEFILQLIDWMALHKLNVFHWHLTDDQGWRLQIKRYPRLTGGQFYSQDTVRQIVAHAAERNITIVPEIDMPGHATAAVVAYPRLASIVPAPAQITAKWGVFSNLYNVDEDTFQFLFNVLSEVIDLFPGKYIHVGGDEAVKDQWRASPHIQARMRELGVPNEAALQGYFIGRMGKFLTAHHRRLIGWDEILEGGITPDATIMSWRGVEGALAAAVAGHDSVLSPAPTLYFDNRQSALDTQPGRGTVITLEDVYKFDPMPAVLAPDQRRHILGVQANVWTEHIRTEQRVEHMVFPRVAAVAEVGWSAAANVNWSSFVARLPDQMRRYRALGIHPFDEQAVSAAALAAAQTPLRRSSFQLNSCTKKILTALEDDAPASGERATYLLDILNPCWIFPAADLSRVDGAQVAVGQLPFAFELGADVHLPHFDTPQSPSGELQIRLDRCDGELIASLSLQPALANDAVTVLPSAHFGHHDGQHDLCFKFAQGIADPIWAIDWVQLLE